MCWKVHYLILFRILTIFLIFFFQEFGVFTLNPFIITEAEAPLDVCVPGPLIYCWLLVRSAPQCNIEAGKFKQGKLPK